MRHFKLFILILLLNLTFESYGQRTDNRLFVGLSLASAGIQGSDALGIKGELGFQKESVWNRRLDFTSALTYGYYDLVISDGGNNFNMQAIGFKNDLSFNFIKNRTIELYLGAGILVNYSMATISIQPDANVPLQVEEVNKINVGGNLLFGFRFKPRRSPLKYEINIVNATLPTTNDFYELAFLQLRVHFKL